jgi:hypothetical protein
LTPITSHTNCIGKTDSAGSRGFITMAKRKMPKELRIGDDRFIPVVLKVVTRHPNGQPNELQCQQTSDVPYDLRGMEKPEFVVCWGRDVSFPGFDDK